jgi:hypothetical protein
MNWRCISDLRAVFCLPSQAERAYNRAVESKQLIKSRSLKTKLRTIRIGLSALALGAAVAAQAAAPEITNFTMVGVMPQFAVQSDLGVTN